MIRRTTTARPPVPGPSQGPPQPGPNHRVQPQITSKLPYPPVDFGLPARPTPPYPTQGYCASSHSSALPSRTPSPTEGPDVQAFRNHGPAARWRGVVHRLLPTSVFHSYQLSRGGTSQTCWIGPPASATDGRPSLSPQSRRPLLQAG